MNGVKLRTLDAPDLLDVLHYMYETDLFTATSEMMDARDKARSMIYEQMYETIYPYNSSEVANYGSDVYGPPLGEDEDLPVPVNPRAMTSRPKAYTPTTKFNPDAANPFNGVLDAPLSH
jgi:hypothetical protein